MSPSHRTSAPSVKPLHGEASDAAEGSASQSSLRLGLAGVETVPTLGSVDALGPQQHVVAGRADHGVVTAPPHDRGRSAFTGEQDMAELLMLLEEWEWARQALIEELQHTATAT